jgi:hypothetical protein
MVFQLPKEIIAGLAAPSHRLYHYLWHGVRDKWLRLTAQERETLLAIDPRWEPPRPSRDEWGGIILNNNAGEDFLYMHRQMIASVNAQLEALGKQPVQGWHPLPGPDDPEYPVPPMAGIREKTDAFWTDKILPAENKLTDPNYLKGLTLGRLGTEIEYGLHAWMHARWSAEPAMGRRPTHLPFLTEIDARWNSPEYDYLLDTYAGHVNPVFWKFHGWIDDCISQWAQVHDIATIEWKGTWLGVSPHHADSHGHHHH